VTGGLPRVWGATAAEVSARYGCDSALPRPGEAWFRAVTVRAPARVMFRWLCQLKVAPYSYDLVDNLGRRSPQTLTPGADILAPGQPVMTIFELVGFRAGEELTLRMRSKAALRLVGDIAISYRVTEHEAGSCRLVVKLVLDADPTAVATCRRRALSWGDLAMMRKQLHTLRGLAEADQPG